jgi:hypothetical protein
MHGMFCGLALSVIMLAGTRTNQFASRAAAMSIPLLLTLGLMEWRLRTFRSDVETLARALEAVEDFAGNAVRIFLRGFAVYVGGLLFAVAGVVAGLRLTDSAIPVALLVAEVALGALYYIDLTLTSIGRLDVVMRAWTIGIAIGGALLATSVLFGADAIDAGWWSAHAAVWIALIILFAAAPRIIAAPCSH